MNLPDFKRQPTILKAIFHINSPMFVAGAEQSKAEFTPSAFKGVLRFWWRALNWSQIFIESGRNKEQALKELHRKEGLIFGVSASDTRQGMGQGGCLVNTLSFEHKKQWLYSDKEKRINVGVNYLLGQGLYHFKDGLTRNAIKHEQIFSAELTVSSQYHDAIIDTLKLIGLLGGFGSRSRHGFGSVTLVDIEKKQLETSDTFSSLNINSNNAVECLQNLFNKYQCFANTELPPLSAFYADTRIDVVTFNSDNSISLLNTVGEELQLYRSWGRNNKVNGKQAEQNFAEDHDFIINMIDGGNNSITHPKRTVFGLPHNYFYSGNTTQGYSGGVDAETGRRASPLIQHIHQSAQGYQLIQCLLKSEFLPTGNSVKIQAVYKKNKHDKPIRKNINVSENVVWQVITDFMDRDAFANKTTVN